MNVIILGAGTFGTAIANELSVNTANKVLLYSSNKLKVDEINIQNTNKSCFPNKHLTKYLKATSDINKISNAEIIFVALPSKAILKSLGVLKPYFKKNVLLVNLSKGLLDDAVTIVESIKNELKINNVVSLKGPSFAIELMEHADTLLTLAYTKELQKNTIIRLVKNTSLHLDFTTDIRGVEVLSVLKNIYAVVIGVVDAQYNSSNTRFMISTKAFSEIRILLDSLKGQKDTLFLACGFGDFCLTSLNDLSRNRTLGLLIGKGFFSADYKSNTVILEGLNAIEMVYHLVDEKVKSELPIFNQLYSFIIKKDSEFQIDFNELVKY